MSYYRDFFPYPPSQPREAKGGIKAHSKRGAFADKWWGKRWIRVLESFGIGARLQRGRAYARRGQVLDLHIGSGEISARVQGSRPKPYQVVLQLKTLSAPEWERVAVALTERPAYIAKLLAGEMPEDIEAVFAQAKLSLFPARQDDLETECSCPDWSNPCKHIAAVYYLLAEAFDQDPFLLFKLRGMDREGLLQLVLGAVQQEEEDESEILPGEPLPADAVQFWGGPEPGPVDFGETTLPILSAVLARRLGALPLLARQRRLAGGSHCHLQEGVPSSLEQRSDLRRVIKSNSAVIQPFPHPTVRGTAWIPPQQGTRAKFTSGQLQANRMVVGVYNRGLIHQAPT